MTNLMDIGDFGIWLRYGERGMSSESIVTVLTGVPIRPGALWEPADPADFRRCEQMLRTVEKHNGEVRAHFAAAMSSVSPAWAALVQHWAEIAALIEEEAPGVLDGRARGNAPRAFALMTQLRFPKEQNK